jgi:broad-specificity NMP kinase
VARVLVTGMSGVGKTTVLDEMSRRGYETIDTDYDGWTSPDGTWDEARMASLLIEQTQVVVSGTVANQGRFYDRFDHVVLLSAPLRTLLDRLKARSNKYVVIDGKLITGRTEAGRGAGEAPPKALAS